MKQAPSGEMAEDGGRRGRGFIAEEGGGELVAGDAEVAFGNGM